MRGAVTIRPVRVGDADELAALYVAQRDHLRPSDPRRDPSFFTPAGQRARLAGAERERDAGAAHRFLILEDGETAGEISISNVVRRAFQSAALGYWVAAERCNRGVATAAVAAACAEAFGPLALHRLEAGTLLRNVASQIVLDRNGFRPFGVAPDYLRIAGEWQDHVLFQRIAGTSERPLGPAGLARRITLLADPQ